MAQVAQVAQVARALEKLEIEAQRQGVPQTDRSSGRARPFGW